MLEIFTIETREVLSKDESLNFAIIFSKFAAIKRNNSVKLTLICNYLDYAF